MTPQAASTPRVPPSGGPVPPAPARGRRPVPRLLVIPGLHDSGPAHWQTWLEAVVRPSQRVVQADWASPDLLRWSATIGACVARDAGGPWIAAAHSFGCLALVQHLLQEPGSPIVAALLVAPADPRHFGLPEAALHQRLRVHATVVGSDNDPWMSAPRAREWAAHWGAHFIGLGEAGHINAEAGYGRLPLARRWVHARTARLARDLRPRHAELAEWSISA